MTNIFDILIILSVFFLIRAGVNFIKKLNVKPKWKAPLTYFLGAAASSLFLFIDRQGPFAKGIYFILIAFFVYVAYLVETRFSDKNKNP